MTWTAPATAVTGNTLTAAFWNAQVRDNMLETAAATAAAAGDIVYADAANSMGSRVAIGSATSLLTSTGSALAWRTPAGDINYSDGSTSGTLDATSYVVADDGMTGDLPSVTVTTGTQAIIMFGCAFASNNTTGEAVQMTYSISGATTQSAFTSFSARGEADAGHDFVLDRINLQSLTAGSNTIQVEAKVDGGIGTITFPWIVVLPL